MPCSKWLTTHIYVEITVLNNPHPKCCGLHSSVVCYSVRWNVTQHFVNDIIWMNREPDFIEARRYDEDCQISHKLTILILCFMIFWKHCTNTWPFNFFSFHLSQLIIDWIKLCSLRAGRSILNRLQIQHFIETFCSLAFCRKSHMCWKLNEYSFIIKTSNW